VKTFLSVVVTIAFVLGATADPALCQTKAAVEKPPQRGGILREIHPSGPRVLGYFPETGPTDEQAMLPGAEKLMEYNAEKQLVPFLAESVTIGKDEKTITVKTLHFGIVTTDWAQVASISADTPINVVLQELGTFDYAQQQG